MRGVVAILVVTACLATTLIVAGWVGGSGHPGGSQARTAANGAPGFNGSGYSYSEYCYLASREGATSGFGPTDGNLCGWYSGPTGTVGPTGPEGPTG